MKGRRYRGAHILLAGAGIVASAEACGSSGSGVAPGEGDPVFDSGGASSRESGGPSSGDSGGASPGDGGGRPDASGNPIVDSGIGPDTDGGAAPDSGPPRVDGGPRDSGPPSVDGGPPDSGPPSVDGGPPFTGPRTAGTVTVHRGQTMGRLSPGFAGFSFEKTHMTDGFFTGTNAPLIAMFKLLGSGIVRIGANDVDVSTWVPGALPVAGGHTSNNVGTADVDALAAFLGATGWKAIYGVSMKTATAPSVAESVYVTNKLGASLNSIEIGNEINYFANNAVGTPVMQWESFETAIRAALPGAILAGPAAAGAATSFTVPFANAEGQKIVLLTDHYYKGAAASNPTIAEMLAIDPSVATQSDALAAAAQANKISQGFRWGEMNSYSGHGAAGVSDVYASALWSLDFMLTTAEHGSNGVNFHGGGQNMDGNECNNGPASCTRPFLYSPIDEVNSQVTAAAPLFYGMLLESRAGVGNMFATTATAAALSFSGYSVSLADGSINVILVNKDAANGVEAAVDTGAAVTEADATYLQGPALDATTGVTFAGAGVTPAGGWAPKPPFALATSGNVATVLVPPASAVIVHAR
jgi:hypothetical protein